MRDLLLLIQYINIIIIFTEIVLVFRSWKSPLHGWLLLGCIAPLVNAVGILAEFGAHTQSAYTTALRLSYLGRVWTALFLFLFTFELCGKKLPKIVKIILVVIHAAIYGFVFTFPNHKLYYEKYIFYREGDFSHFAHTNGIVHHIYTILQCCYIIGAFILLFTTLHKEKAPTARKRLIMVICSFAGETIFYIVQISGLFREITNVFDVTMLGYTFGNMFMFIAINRFDLLGTGEIAREYMIDRLSESIIAVDTNGVVQYFNEPAKKLYPELKVSAKSVPAEITEALAQCGNITVNGRIYKPEENELSRDGARVGTLYALVDETDHYHYMEVLEEQKSLADSANQAKSAFLANMSHDIRTPINAVLGMNEMIQRECGDERILGYSDKIKSSGNTLLGLINDILDLSKIEAGKLDIIPVDYDLTSVLNDLVTMVKPRADAKGLTLETKVDEKIPKLLHGDEIRLKQIITNILTNAVKYTEKGSVTFSVGYEKNGEDSILLRISVADTGIGIKPEDIPKLFSEFDRIEEERNRGIEGTGLGMSITQSLLAMMGSRLEVESEYGKGSVFSFGVAQRVVKWEPVGSLEEALRRSLSERTGYHEKFTAPDAQILVVDDTPMNLEVFVSLLKRTLVKIDTAESGAKCIELAKKKKYDIIFCDHMMPEKDGIETLTELKAIPDCPNAGTPAICLTANAVSGSREKYLNAGFDNYLTKPVEPERLEQMIMEYLPKEKLVKAAADREQSEKSSEALPEWLYGISEIDTEKGLTLCGTPETYLSTLTTYAGTVSASADEAEKLFRDGDIRNATVKIHALKSTSRVIGAAKLGAIAEELEAAGNANDTDKLNARAGELFERCRALGEELSPLLEKSGLPLISEDELNEAYTLIREFLSVEDYESVMQVIEGLKEYSYPDSGKTRCEALVKAAAEFDYDRINGIMEE